MSLEILTRPQWEDAWTAVTVEGEHEEEVANILVGRLLACDHEVLIEDEDGEMLSWEDYDGTTT